MRPYALWMQIYSSSNVGIEYRVKNQKEEILSTHWVFFLKKIWCLDFTISYIKQNIRSQMWIFNFNRVCLKLFSKLINLRKFFNIEYKLYDGLISGYLCISPLLTGYVKEFRGRVRISSKRQHNLKMLNYIEVKRYQYIIFTNNENIFP